MRLFIALLILSQAAFAIEGRGLDPERSSTAPRAERVTPSTEAPQVESNASSQKPEEIRKAEPSQAPINPLFKITKVHEVRTDKPVNSKGNKALEYEQKYWMFGAVTKEQQEEKKGQYFVISWVNKGAAQNIEARFEYRQINTRDVVRKLSVFHTGADGANRSQFSVVGKAFKDGGEVASYRITLWSGDELLAESKSFIW